MNYYSAPKSSGGFGVNYYSKEGDMGCGTCCAPRKPKKKAKKKKK